MKKQTQKTKIKKAIEAIIKPIAIALTYVLNGMTKAIKRINK